MTQNQNTNITEFLYEKTKKHSGFEAFVINRDQRRTLTFEEFYNAVFKVSQALSARFQQKSFKLALWSENRTEWCVMALATWHAGGTLIPLMHIGTESEITNILNAAKPDVLFISPNIKTTQKLPCSEIYHLDFETKPLKEWLSQEITDFSSPCTHNDLAVLIFTSGTTGHPKGVMLTHENIITNLSDTYDFLPQKRGRAVSVLPLSHMFELTAGFLAAHMKGFCFSYPKSLKPEDVLSELRAHKATTLVAVPLLFEIIDRTIQEKLKALPFILRWVGRYKIHQTFGGHIEFFCTGGAKIDSAIIERFESLGFKMIQGYGLTETSPILTITPFKRKPHQYASVGKPLTHVKIKIENPNENGEGEILASGPNIFMGYFENETATNEVLKNGWFCTGDIGRIDSEDFLYITGRKKDIIVTPNGKNVYPEELEEILKASPLFSEVSILGLDSPRGELIHAVVVPFSPLSQEQARAEIERLTQNMADYKRIQGVSVFRQELPKTPTKKVKKHLLKQMISHGEQDLTSQENLTPLDTHNDKEAWLEEKLKAISKRPEIFKEHSLKHDLNIDSLTFMELVSLLETQWGIHIADEDFEKIMTVGDVISRLGSTSAIARENKKKPFDYAKNNTAFMNITRWVSHALVIRPFLKVFFKLKVKDSETLKNINNFILTPNHSSHLDVITALSTVPLSKLNKTYSVAADDYFFNHTLKSFFVRLFFNAIPFERKSRVEKGFKVCEDILKAGGNLIIFPEGTRSTTGKLAGFKPGVGRLLATKNYHAIPTLIQGAFEAFPKGAYFPKLSPIVIKTGQKLQFKNIQTTLEGYQEIAKKLQDELIKLYK